MVSDTPTQSRTCFCLVLSHAQVTGGLTCGTNHTGATTSAQRQNYWMFAAAQQGTYTFNSCGSSYDTCVIVHVNLISISVTVCGNIERLCLVMFRDFVVERTF